MATAKRPSVNQQTISQLRKRYNGALEQPQRLPSSAIKGRSIKEICNSSRVKHVTSEEVLRSAR